MEELEGVVDDLCAATNLRWGVEKDQDASFFATIADSDRFSYTGTEHPYALAIRFSLWGRLAGIVSNKPTQIDELATIQKIINRHDFMLIPHEALIETYDGQDRFYDAVGDGLWFDRFFQYY